MNSGDNIERAIERMHMRTDEALDRRILADSFAALEKATLSSPSEKQSILRIRFTSPVVAAGAVAAALIVAIAFFFGSIERKPIELKNVYLALSQVASINISRYVEGEAAPYQQQWASRMLNVNMIKFPDRTMLLDLTNGLMKTRSSTSSNVRAELIPDEKFVNVRNTMHRTFGLFPFTDITAVPQDVLWQPVTGRHVRSLVPGSHVYDLIWTSDSPQGDTHKRRYFLEKGTRRPLRVETYVSSNAGRDYDFLRFETVSYPDDDKIEEVVYEEFGSATTGTNYPEYMGTPGSVLRPAP